jgi:Major Facilitator Superfamily
MLMPALSARSVSPEPSLGDAAEDAAVAQPDGRVPGLPQPRITVVNTALPATEEDLQASFNDLHWVVDAYTLTLAVFLVAPISGALLSKVRARVLISLGLVRAGGGLMLIAGVGPADDWTGLLGGFIVAGAGIGLLNPAIAEMALSVVAGEQGGMASGVNDTFRQVGISVGVALWGAIFLGAGPGATRAARAGRRVSRGPAQRVRVRASRAAQQVRVRASRAPPRNRCGPAGALRKVRMV